MSGQREMSPTRARIKELSAAGVTPREIAAALRISTQAVYKHLKALRLNGQIEKAS